MYLTIIRTVTDICRVVSGLRQTDISQKCSLIGMVGLLIVLREVEIQNFGVITGISQAVIASRFAGVIAAAVLFVGVMSAWPSPLLTRVGSSVAPFLTNNFSGVVKGDLPLKAVLKLNNKG